jgi:hypothetical protein
MLLMLPLPLPLLLLLLSAVPCSLPGDYGFDPLSLAEPSGQRGDSSSDDGVGSLQWLSYAELIHGRCGSSTYTSIQRKALPVHYKMSCCRLPLCHTWKLHAV